MENWFSNDYLMKKNSDKFVFRLKKIHLIIDRLNKELFNAYVKIIEKKYQLDIDPGKVFPNQSTCQNGLERLADVYQPISPHYFLNLFRRSIKEAPDVVTFVDIGCGKGRACILAQREFIFQRIIGIDCSESLIEVAKNNQRKMKIKIADFFIARAENFELPSGKSLVYLFNPFDAQTLGLFLDKNLCHFKRHGSVLLYANDVCKNELFSRGFVPIYQENRGSIWKIYSRDAW